MHRSTTLQTIAFAAVFLAAGCTDQDQPTAPSDQPDPLSPSLRQGPGDNPNALARGIRGFGGFFFDAQGTPTVYLKDAAERSNTERALAPFFRAQGLSPAAVRVRRGDFDWVQLERWFAQASAEILGQSGGVFVDADEASNRVRIGVERGAIGRTRSLVARLGIPADAVIVEETEPIEFAAHTSGSGAAGRGRTPDQLPRIPLHARLQRRAGAGRIRSSPTRTAPIPRGNREYAVLATAGTRGAGADRDRGSRPTHISVGRAAVPTGGAAASATRRGRPTRRVSLHPRHPRQDHRREQRVDHHQRSFTITGEGGAAVGQTVNKVGRTTGWTQGLVTNTCVNTGVSGSNIVQLCQTFVSAGVGGGDSGSPVFRGTTSVTLGGNPLGWITPRAPNSSTARSATSSRSWGR